MKCIVCGTKEASIHGQCEDCYLKHVQVTGAGSIEVTICPKCGAFKIGNNWSKGKMEQQLSRKIAAHLESKDPNVTLEVENNSVVLKRLEGKIEFLFDIKTEGQKMGGYPMTVPSRILLNSCPTCNKISGSYYESIIQLRTLTAEYSPIIDKVLDGISGMLHKMHNNETDSFVSKIQPMKEGVDIYLGKKNDGIKVSKYIHDHYFSDTTRTKKLAGRREGGDFYRYTFLVRLFNLPPGAIIWGKDKTYILEKVGANSLTVIDPANEKRYDLLQNDFNTGSYSYSQDNVESRKFIVVSSENNESTIMDNENFAIYTVKGKYQGEVKAFNYKGKFIVSLTH